MPKTPQDRVRSEALRRAWLFSTTSVVAAGLVAAASAVIHPAQAGAVGRTAGDPHASAAAVPTTAAAALIVGGTTFSTMDPAAMAELTTTFATTLISVPYPAQLWPYTPGEYLGASVAAGVNSVIGLLGATYSVGSHLIVWGISQGALVLNATQQVLAGNPSAPPPHALTFVRVADPASAIGGMLNFLPDLVLREVLHFDMRTAPADSPYDNIVITNQYDAFADFPDRPTVVSVLNAIAGLFTRHGQTATADLGTVPANNITVSVNSFGATTTTYLVPSPFLPLTQPLRDAGVPTEVVDRLDGWLRPLVDAGYSRTGQPDSDSVPAAAPRTRTAAARRAATAAGRATADIPSRTRSARITPAASRVSSRSTAVKNILPRSTPTRAKELSCTK